MLLWIATGCPEEDPRTKNNWKPGAIPASGSHYLTVGSVPCHVYMRCATVQTKILAPTQQGETSVFSTLEREGFSFDIERERTEKGTKRWQKRRTSISSSTSVVSPSLSFRSETAEADRWGLCSATGLRTILTISVSYDRPIPRILP